MTAENADSGARMDGQTTHMHAQELELEHGHGKLARLLRVVELTGEVEIDCTTCLDLVPIYVDDELAGADVARRMPALHQHLAICGDCHEEYEALRDLAALEATDGLPDRATLLGTLKHSEQAHDL